MTYDDVTAKRVVVCRQTVGAARRVRFGVAIRADTDSQIITPEVERRDRAYVGGLLDRAGRKGVTQDVARTTVRTNATVIAAIALHRGEADAMICGVEGRFDRHLRWIRDIVGLGEGVHDFLALIHL